MNVSAIGLATPSEVESIERLVANCHLPLDGLRSCLAHTLVARDGDRVVGTVALEVYKSGVLLRSVAVDPRHRGQGLGEALTEEAFVLARRTGATTAYLLTTTAADFFPRFGFERIERSEVPDDVRQSVEFTSACPSTAIVMRAPIRGHVW